MPVSRALVIGLIVVVIIIVGVAAYYLTRPPAVEKKVVVATGWGGPEGEAFRAALDEFAKKYGVKIEIKQPKDMREYVLTQLQSGQPEFDVAIVPWPHFVRELGEKGWLTDVTDIVNKIKGDLISQYFVESVKTGGKYYAVPIKMWVKGLWVNKEALAKAGLSLDDIKTLEGFKAACKALKDAGIQPLVSGAADKWPLSDIFEAFIIRLGGPDLHQAMTHDPEAWKRPEVKEAFKLLAELLKEGCWGDPKVAIGEKWEAQVPKLAEGEAAMYFMGNWITLFIQTHAKEKGVDPSEYLSKVVYVLPPEIKPGLKPGVVGGGDWAIMPAKAPHPEWAKKLMEWLAGPEYQELMVKRGGYLAVNVKVPKEAYTPADYSVIETIKTYGAEILPDLDDNIVPSALQLEIWNSLFELWGNPDNWEDIYNRLVSTIELQMEG